MPGLQRSRECLLGLGGSEGCQQVEQETTRGLRRAGAGAQVTVAGTGPLFFYTDVTVVRMSHEDASQLRPFTVILSAGRLLQCQREMATFLPLRAPSCLPVASSLSAAGTVFTLYQ